MSVLSDRLLRVALLGVVPEDDQHVIADAQGEIGRLKDVIDWIECWVSNPASSYSMMALDGLFGMTRDKIAALRTPEDTAHSREDGR